MCLKYKKKACPKKTPPNRRTRACPKFVFDTKHANDKILKEAIEISNSKPVTQIEALICLLESGLRLRSQDLTLGLPTEYIDEKLPTVDKAYIISSPKRDKYAYAVCFPGVPTKNTVVRLTLDKNRFFESRDKELIKSWKIIDDKLLFLKNANSKIKVLVAAFNIIGKRYVKLMFKLNKIKVQVQGRKISDIIKDILKDYE